MDFWPMPRNWAYTLFLPTLHMWMSWEGDKRMNIHGIMWAGLCVVDVGLWWLVYGIAHLLWSLSR